MFSTEPHDGVFQPAGSMAISRAASTWVRVLAASRSGLTGGRLTRFPMGVGLSVASSARTAEHLRWGTAASFARLPVVLGHIHQEIAFQEVAADEQWKLHIRAIVQRYQHFFAKATPLEREPHFVAVVVFTLAK